MTRLYAWVRPLNISSYLDHTWVTTYDNRVDEYSSLEEVAHVGENYWMCWGDFHPHGDPVSPIGNVGGSLPVASCLVEPNADSRTVPAARGTIFKYGIDGVCHQLANQVLYATKTSFSPPATVSAAKGYSISSYLYGTYGRQKSAWQQKVAHCAGTNIGGRHIFDEGRTSMEASDMDDLPDDFITHAAQHLGDDPELLAKFLELRTDTQAFIARDVPGFESPNADTLNARNQHLIDQAAILLGPVRFEQIFGMPAGTKIDLVDPAMLETREREA